ncbi:c-type cytochrome biogenesis protein CcmI [Acuticoccus sp. MNP-M23]|uniref:c-type cytochrome biogenesis protein CcmI n=1 Tax=Acuticoccus sp. MNP-M23 TaxID=3072793 RepID=UPI002815A317|nr:c-type cytochrome biogenesis protein CcmI [Acuticoccus sp. MNP-M23]WMS41645.1 c-type cytochrome biogenesis protein CcmI [Acuticoccus sp. MNP-M23]
MILWIALAVLATLTVVALLRPLLARNVEVGGGDDREVYAAQLTELEADVERGLIADKEAAAARTEIARRLLRSRDARGSGPSRGRLTAVALAVALFVPVFSVGAYVWLGTPQYGDQPLAARLAPIDDDTLQEMLAKAEQRLATEPDDAEGWLAIAPVYQRLGRFADSAKAYGKVNDLLGERTEWLTAEGENLAFAQGGEVSAEGAALFERALALDPQALRPAIFLAIAARQAGDFMEAGERWRHILARSDGTEPWLQIANAEFMRIAEASGAPTSVDAGPRINAPAPQGGPRIGTAPPTQATPSGAGTAAAPSGTFPGGAPPPAVVAMVEGLAARLAASGGTVDEWTRLVRSLNVLGRTDEAQQAVRDGLAALDGSDRAAFAASPEVKETAQ